MINTRGFGVDVMPRYTPVDPKLVVLDPNQLTDGIESSFKVASDLDKLKAFRAQQQEIADLKEARVAATRARYGASTAEDLGRIKIAPEATNLTLADLSGKLAVKPFTNQLDLSKAQFDVAQQPLLQQVASEQNKAAADSAYNLGEATRNEAAFKARDSADWAERADAADKELNVHILALEQQRSDIQYALDHVGANQDAKRRLMEAQTRNEEALSRMNEGKAAFYQWKASPNGKSFDQYRIDMQHEKLTRENLKAVASTPIATDENGKKTTLGEYLYLSRNPDGTVKDEYKASNKPNYFGFGGGAGAKYNPYAESLLPEMQDHMGTLQQMVKARRGSTAEPVAPVLAAPTSVISAPPIDPATLAPEAREAYEWAIDPANANDERAKKILDAIATPGQ